MKMNRHNRIVASKSSLSIDLLISQLSDSESQSIDHHHTIKQSQLKKSQSKLNKKLSKSDTDLNFRIILDCLNTQESNDTSSAIQTTDYTPFSYHFLRVKNIQKEQSKKNIYFKSRNSKKVVKILSRPLKMAKISELPASEIALNIGSAKFIHEWPIEVKIVKDLHQPICEATEVSSFSQSRQQIVNSTDDLVHVRVVKKPEWKDTFFGINLSKDEVSKRFKIDGFNPLGVAKYLSLLELKNMVNFCFMI